MKKLILILDKIAEEIIMLNEGDLFAIDKIYSNFESIYEELISYNRNLEPILSALLELLKAELDLSIRDFSTFIKILSEGINFIQKVLYNLENNINEEIPPPENLVNRIYDLTKDTYNTDSNKILSEKEKEMYDNFIIETVEHIEIIESEILDLEQNPNNIEKINSIFRSFHTIKGTSGFLNFEDIGFIAHKTEALLTDIIKDNIKINSDYLDLILNNAELIKGLISHLKGILEGQNIEKPEINRTEIETRIDSLIKTNKNSSQISSDETEITIKNQSKKTINSLNTSKITNTPYNKGIINFSTIKVNSTKFDNLLNMIGELMIVNNQVTQDIDIAKLNNQRLRRNLAQLNRTVSYLQKLSISLRLVEIKQTFQKLSLQVKDLSSKTGKQINLIINGKDTEIDRNIVDDIFEPLVHMVRNAIDHGIEPSEERLQKGKDPKGTISISAYHKGGNLIVEIEDDGKGLDREKILKKAIDMGTISQDDELSEKEIDYLIFNSGLSLAKEVTNISGRGVGMDVVKDKIKKLRGNIEIASEKDKGTKFVIKLPLTMSIIDGIIIGIGNNKYVLPTISVKRIFRPDQNNYSTFKKKNEMIDIGNQLIPLIRLYELFKIEPQYKNINDAYLILVENDGREKCLMVDRIISKQEVVVKPLGERLKEIECFSSATILGDGGISLILDVDSLFNLHNRINI